MITKNFAKKDLLSISDLSSEEIIFLLNQTDSFREVNEREISNDNKKIGRNEKCPCGSGKKYKHCCGSI